MSLKAKVLVEEPHHMVLEAICHGARVRPGIDFKAIDDSITRENVMELTSVNLQSILVAYIDRDGMV